MIRVNKPQKAPAVLISKGKKKRLLLCLAYNKGKRAFSSSDFDGDVYSHASVREALKRAQYDKCCFCESKISHISYGDVEHFRPKAGVRQKRGDTLEIGYYWLAYEWQNLYLSCQICNQRHKENLFPLVDPLKRARLHRDKTGREKTLFIDPGKLNPERYISFRKEVPFPIRDNPAGKITIEALGLKRDPLKERRKDHFDMIEALYWVAYHSKDPKEGPKAHAKLQEYTKDSAQYAAMTRAALVVLQKQDRKKHRP